MKRPLIIATVLCMSTFAAAQSIIGKWKAISSKGRFIFRSDSTYKFADSNNIDSTVIDVDLESGKQTIKSNTSRLKIQGSFKTYCKQHILELHPRPDVYVQQYYYQIKGDTLTLTHANIHEVVFNVSYQRK